MVKFMILIQQALIPKIQETLVFISYLMDYLIQNNKLVQKHKCIVRFVHQKMIKDKSKPHDADHPLRMPYPHYVDEYYWKLGEWEWWRLYQQNSNTCDGISDDEMKSIFQDLYQANSNGELVNPPPCVDASGYCKFCQKDKKTEKFHFKRNGKTNYCHWPFVLNADHYCIVLLFGGCFSIGGGWPFMDESFFV